MLKKYFFKRVRSSFMTMIIPTLILFLVLGFFFISMQQEKVEDKGGESLVIYSESLEKPLYNLAYQLDLMTTNSLFTLSLRNLMDLNIQDRHDKVVFDMLKNFLYGYQTSSDYIDSVYLYLDGKDNFLSSATGQIADLKTSYDQEWFAAYRDMQERGAKVFTQRRWIRRNSYDEPLEAISFYYKMTYVDGVIVINVDKGKYGRALRYILELEQQKILLFNSEGSFIASSDISNSSEPVQEQFIDKLQPHFQANTYEKINRGWEKVGGRLYYLYIGYSEYTDMYRVSAISIDYMMSELRIYFLLVLAVLLLDVIIVFLRSYFYTKGSFAFIQECIDIFAEAERGEIIAHQDSDIKDEYGIILNKIIYMHLRDNQMRLDLLEQKHQYEIAEKSALQLQINPHFISNTLQIMDFEIVKRLGVQDPLHKMSQQLSMVVRYAMRNPTGKVSLRKELEYLKAYLEIQKLRFGIHSIIYFEVDNSVQDDEVFRLLLQPLVENCFEHGIRSENDSLIIKIKIYDKGDKIYFAVLDNGKGMGKEEVSELLRKINSISDNIGLANVNHRLLLHYGEKSALKIQSRKNKGTVIHFVVPKNNY